MASLSSIKAPGTSTRSTISEEDRVILETWRAAISGGETYRVVASDSVEVSSAGSAYVCDGTADDVQVQAAITAASAAGGGTVLLSDGTFTFASEVQLASNVRILGQGRETVLDATWVQGSSLEYFFDGTSLDHVEFGNLSVVTTATYDVTPTGFIGDGRHSLIRVIGDGTNGGIYLHDIYGENVAFIVNVKDCVDVNIENISGKQVFGCVSLIQDQYCTVSNIRAEKAETLVDCGGCLYVSITNCSGTASTARNTDEAFDVGGSQYVSISNFTVKGFYCGARLKFEANSLTDSEPKHITISNGYISGCAQSGVRLDNVASTVNRIGPVLCENVIVQTTESGAGGFTGVDFSDGVQVNNCRFETDGIGVLLDGAQDAVVSNNYIASTSNIGIRMQEGQPVIRPTIAGNRIMDGTYGIYLVSAEKPVIRDNILKDLSLDAMWIFEPTRPVICGNTITGAGDCGIRCEWNSTTGLDTTDRGWHFQIDNNYIEDWSATALGDRGIWLEITGVAGDSYDYGSLCGNHLIVTSAGETTVNGIRIETSVNADYLMICNNVFTANMSNKLFATATLEANCKIKDNINEADV